MMNVWIMNHYAADMFRDKSGRHFWFSKKLEEKGYKPTVFCASTYHNKAEVIDTGSKKYRIEYDGRIPFVFVRTTPSTGNGIDRVKNMLLFFKNLFPVAKTFSKLNGKPDVIIASSVHPLTMVAGILIAKRLKVPCVCEVRDLWPEAIFSFGKTKPDSILGRLLTAGEHWIYRMADALIFTKEGDTDYLKEKKWDTGQGGDVDLAKCHYINNGVNIEAFENSIKNDVLRDADLENEGCFNVVYAGMIRPVNNVGNLLDCAKLLREHKDIQFLVYGDGSQLQELIARAKDEELNNVKFKGFVQRKYIPYILSKSSVNILNYSQEKFNWSRGNSSNKLFEYMASGKPVISTVKMGYCIIRQYGCGFSLENNTPGELAEYILKIKDMDESEYKSLCVNARTGAADFDFNVLTEKLIQVIESVKDGAAKQEKTDHILSYRI